MISPTPGRIVWYRPGPDEQRPVQSDQPLAAIVAAVHSDREVNLAVFDHDGLPYSRTNVQLVQEGDTAPEHGFAEWMPFQKGQAAKVEALEAKAATAAAAAEPQPVVELQPTAEQQPA